VRHVLWGLTAFFLVACSHFSTQRNQEQAKVLLQVGTEHLNKREYYKALEATHQAIKHDPAYASAYNHLALIHMEMKNFEKSEQAFNRALEIQPDYPEVFNNVGVLRNRQERYGEALIQFEKALQSDHYPTPENALTNMGYAYYRLGELSLAKLHHQKALDLVPNFCLASKNLGDVYAKEKNFSKASEHFHRAVTHCPLFQESQYKLGLALMKLGKKAGAKFELERLLARHKSGPYVEKSQQILKLLR